MEQEPTKAGEPVRTPRDPLDESLHPQAPVEAEEQRNGKPAFVPAERPAAEPLASELPAAELPAAGAVEATPASDEESPMPPVQVPADSEETPNETTAAPEAEPERVPFVERTPIADAPVTVAAAESTPHTGEAAAEETGEGASHPRTPAGADDALPTYETPAFAASVAPAASAEAAAGAPSPEEPLEGPAVVAEPVVAEPVVAEEESTLFAPDLVTAEVEPPYRRAATLRLRRMRVLRPDRFMQMAPVSDDGTAVLETPVPGEAAAAPRHEPHYETGPNWMLAFVCLWAGGTSLNEAWHFAGQSGLGPALLRNMTFLGYGVLGLGLLGFALEALQHGKRRDTAATLLASLVPALLTLAGVILLVLSNEPGRRI